MSFSPADLQNTSENYSFRGSSSSTLHDEKTNQIPHEGSLCRVEGEGQTTYILEISIDHQSTHGLVFRRKDFDFSLRLFSIMDTESRGRIDKSTVEEFMALRCPVFWRRDEDMEDRGARFADETSPTFEEVWRAVISCRTTTQNMSSDEISLTQIGLEGWMIFCRFIALAQYLEAKRRFSGRHLQQTMRHRNAPRGSEVVMVDVPPAAPPVALTASALAQYELENQKCLPLPELDLDHSLLAAHDVLRRCRQKKYISSRSAVGDHVKIDLFGSSPIFLSSSSSTDRLEFCLTLLKRSEDNDRSSEEIVTVRRSMDDIEWLNDTFVSQKVLGGTLCGRILPPFPGNKVYPRAQIEESSFVKTGGAIAAATNAGRELATAGVGILKEGIKSLWGGYISNSESTSKSYPEKPKKSTPIVNAMKNYYNPNSPIGKARYLERYLNYLLKHPALSTSFPLNTILKASQSGLEAAKQSLEEHTRAARDIKVRTPHMDDGKTSTFWNLTNSGRYMHPNLSWVRTAAQAAVALQLHGILETTGLPSASARLQHASLPSFNNSRNSGWSEDDDQKLFVNDSEDSAENLVQDSFEKGVLHVQDELASECIMDQGDGYDLLPLPVPAPERQILNVSEAKKNSVITNETRFRYGGPEGFAIGSTDDEKRVYLGEMAIDENIDKLREIIGSVDNILSRCMASSSGIERSRREKFMIHLDILRGLDSWEGLRGKFVSQRALLKGVSNMEQSREVFEESDLTLMDGISWQTALAHSAVSAAEDVRSTVRAARTARNAKDAAISAAYMAQSVCGNGKFETINESRTAETRASIAQSHAIHAAVVEHEAKTAKRRSTLALAHDVKCWNVHRKREVLKISLAHAKSQHEATRRAVDAWSCLRDGFVGSTIIPSTQSWKPTKLNLVLVNDQPEVETTIFGDSGKANKEHHPIVAVEHRNLKLPIESQLSKSQSIGDVNLSHVHDKSNPVETFVRRSPLSEEADDESNASDLVGYVHESRLKEHLQSKEAHSDADNEVSYDSYLPSKTMLSKAPVSFEKERSDESSLTENDEVLTSSMQSLVDGLMNWGGIEIEDNFALPTGMAASIALEESAAFGSNL
mmetsp:Transcript_26136/g.61382  ORF Transcript_26136/g.61382 Transcript_26136/m.61382 type:complete len:1098 (-) Transcript_26136:651-3944(-)|eukprot:CAMPEP_0197176232 /NCGR_PEP_ID=MMETSP1423-20130617/2225_1 /TAXON_ID=476441 /ORGANISM="Pseudo-nitzschia heimii, Strain UNC1101" /LENGTH=1097 /DNA_ID=CAMNT_0042625575 /DNA_START=413 /DNA_END=3706 /DNA_ORIENTATION=+